MERRIRNERIEVPMTVSVAGLVSYTHPINGDSLLVVKKRKSGKWGLPAGGIILNEQEGRPETPIEALARELREEAGFDMNRVGTPSPRLKGIVNLPHPRQDRHSLGVVYQMSLGGSKPNLDHPIDQEEIEEVKFFSLRELRQLVDDEEQLFRPDFNSGIIRWWVRNWWTGDNLDAIAYGYETLDENTVRQFREEKAWL